MNANDLFLLALDMLAKSTGILLLAFAVNSLWRSASAAQRCLVWGASFAVLLLLPFALQHTASPLPATLLHFAEAPIFSEEDTVAPVAAARQFPQLGAAQLAFVMWIAGAVLILGRRAFGGWRVRRLRSQSRTLQEGC